MLNAIDHVILPAAELDHSAERFAQLGLTLTPPARHLRQGTENRVFFVGNAEQEFYVELLGIHDRALAHEAKRDALLDAVDEQAGLWRVMLATDDLASMRARLEGAGVSVMQREIARDDGTKIGDVLEADTAAAGCAFSIIAYAEPGPERRGRHAAGGLFNHDFPLTRLDHLAAIVRDLDQATSFWTETLGVPVFGEVPMGPALIRQMKVGDAIIELIGATSDDSPMRQRPPGLISMCAFEVPDLAGAVETLRGRGFTSGDPAPGPLPGTRVASIPAPEMAGMTLQLLEYV